MSDEELKKEFKRLQEDIAVWSFCIAFVVVLAFIATLLALSQLK